MSTTTTNHEVQVLMVEDDAGDALITQEALADAKVRNRVHLVPDGVEAMAFLRRQGPYGDAPRPDVILLDLNMPRMNGLEVLRALHDDANLRLIPVVVLTTSAAEEDIVRSYELNANCYVTKPVDLDQFLRVVTAIEDFWLTVVKLPTREDQQ